MRGVEKPSFLTLDARQTFTQLRQALIRAPILRHFDPECYIQVKTDTSSYTIDGILSQMTSKTGQWHPVAYYYSQKIIPAKTHYEKYDTELLAIIKTFKNWYHYLEDC